ncbi:MAG: ComEC family competence protein [Candidatus Taylorbacteria bacterium]|nr:ComEC family competence protein [Candidatus Taylorbacteria bacterium]
MKSFLFWSAAAGFASGASLYSAVSFGYSFVFLLVLVGEVIYFLWRFSFRGSGLVLALAVYLVFVGLGAGRMEKTIRSDIRSLDGFLRQEVKLTGKVLKEPEFTEGGKRAVLKVQKVETLGDFSLRTKVLLYLPRYTDVQYGDVLIVEGKLAPAGGERGYRRYLEKDGIHYQIFEPRVVTRERGKGGALKEKLFELKGAFLTRLRESLGEPHASLAGGLVLGAGGSLGEKTERGFRRSGLIHIVVLSGYNIMLVAYFVMRALFFLPTFFSRSAAAGAVILFVVLSGGSATAVRAAIMATIALLARTAGHRYSLGRALALAGISMLLFNPRLLLSDVSFQLSFLATLALIALAPLLEGGFKKIRWLFFREIIVATVSVQLMVLPLLLYTAGQASLFGLVANVLVLPFVPAAMFLAFAAPLLAFVSEFLALPFFAALHWLLSYILSVSDFFGSLPFAAVEATISAPVLAVVYTLIFIFLRALWRKKLAAREAEERTILSEIERILLKKPLA